ncbi:MAG: hypothetical protein ACOYBY_17725 [Dermatophilaceae bacterium]
MADVKIVVKADGTHASAGFRRLRQEAKDTGRSIKREFDDAEKGSGSALSRLAKSVGSSFTNAGKSFDGAKLGGVLSPQMAVAGAVAGAAMAPAFGAAATAGILGGIGGGALALGIKSASTSPEVQSAWKSFTAQGAKVSEEFGKPFRGPLVSALSQFGKVLAGLEDPLARISKASAAWIKPLADGLAGIVTNSMPGVEKAVKAAGPLFQALGDAMPGLGTAVSDALSSIASGAKGAATLTRGSLRLISAGIRGTGAAVGWLSRMFQRLSENEGLRSSLRVVASVLRGVGRAITAIASPAVAEIRRQIRSLTSTAHSNRSELRQVGHALQTLGHWAAKVAPIAGRLLANNLRATGAAIRFVVSAVGAGVRAFNRLAGAARSAGRAARGAFSGVADTISSVVGVLPGFRTGGVTGRAATGGPRGNQVLVGESGPEVVNLPTGSTVYPNGNRRIMGGGGGGVAEVRLMVSSGGTQLDRLLVEVLRKSIRSAGGNVQVVLGS